MLQCVATVLVGFSDPMIPEDKKALESAKTRCVVHYADSPCLKKFIKREQRVYWAICGKKEESK